MNSLQNISVVTTNWIPALVFIGMSDMLRALLTFEIEERLGRKLTDWEWQYFLRERNQKSEIDSVVNQRNGTLFKPNTLA